MAEPTQFQIRVFHPRLKGDCVVVLGDGRFVDDALKDAAGHICMPFRPKQDGRSPELLKAALMRPDGSCYSLTKDELKRILEGTEASVTKPAAE